MGARGVDPLEAVRDAFQRHAWQEAYDALKDADTQHALGGDGLHLLAQAAYWTARPDETIEALERAFGAYMNEGDVRSAAMIAFRIVEQNAKRGSMPQAQGWAARAEHLAEGHP